jgi:hypothetical protein
MSASAVSAHPGLVLVLAEPSRTGAGSVVLRRLAEGLDGAPAVRVLDLTELRRLGLAAPELGPLARTSFERALAERICESLRSAHGAAEHHRFVIGIVALLEDAVAARHAVALIPYLEGALARVALPRGTEPALVAVHVLRDRWTPLEAAGLYAWLKEFGAALHLGAQRNDGLRGYTLASVIGHGDSRHATRLSTREQVAAIAADFLTVCLCSRMLDAVLAQRRGRALNGRFSAFGIAPWSEVGGDPERAVGLSDVRLPLDPLAHGHGETALLRASVGSDRAPDGWERVDGCTGARIDRGWLVQMATNLSITDLAGAREWRAHYAALSPAERAEVHGIRAAAGWPDPFDQLDERAQAEAAEPLDAFPIEL